MAKGYTVSGLGAGKQTIVVDFKYDGPGPAKGVDRKNLHRKCGRTDLSTARQQ